MLELLAKGDLHNHLISAKSESDSDIMNPHTLLSYSRQVVCGMNYLANKHFIHRDLAARNILVSEDEICKVLTFLSLLDYINSYKAIVRGDNIYVPP